MCLWGSSNSEDCDCESQWEKTDILDVLCSVAWDIANQTDGGCSGDWNIAAPIDLNCESDFDSATPSDLGCESDWEIAPTLDVDCSVDWDKMIPMDSNCGSNWDLLFPKDTGCGSEWLLASAKDTECNSPWQETVPLDVICSLEYDYNSVLNKKTVVFHCEYPWMAERSFILIDQDVIVKRVSDNQVIEVLPGLSIRTDIDSAFWTISGATATRIDANYIRPSVSGPVEIEVIVNNYTWRFLVESLNENYAYEPGGSYSFSGTSPSIVLTRPYTQPQTKQYTVDTQAEQITQNELTGTGWSWEWNVMDWDIDAFLFSVSEQTTMEIISTIAKAIGGVIHTKGGFPNGTPYEQTIEINYRYPTSPKTWDVGVPDITIIDGIFSESMTWTPKPKYDHVFVTGEGAGFTVDVRRDGEDWDNCAPTIVDGLTLEVNVARERGRNFLDQNGYDQTHYNIALPLPDSTDGNPELCLPGYMIEIHDAFETWRGQVVSLQVDVQDPGVTQTIGIERHYTDLPLAYLDVTLNPYDKAGSIALSGGNLVAVKSSGGSAHVSVRATTPIGTGLRYFELNGIGDSFVGRLGVCNNFIDFSASNISAGPDAVGTRGAAYISSGNLEVSGTVTVSWGSTFLVTDTIGIAVDGSTGKIWFAVNNVWQASGDPVAGTNPAATISGDLYPAISFYSENATRFIALRFKTTSWTYAAPTGFSEIPQPLEPTTYQRASCSDRSSDMLPNASGYQVKRITTATAHRGIRGRLARSSGKRYFEMIYQSATGLRNHAGVGNSSAALGTYVGSDTNSWSFGQSLTDMWKLHVGGVAMLVAGLASQGDIFGYAVDIDAGKIWFSYNGSWLEGNPSSGTGESFSGLSATLYPMMSLYDVGNTAQFVFLEADWTYSAPTGFVEW